MEFVKIAHPNVPGQGECALSALHLWEGMGWHQVEVESPLVAEADEPLSQPTEPDRAAEPPASPKASRRAANTEE